MANKRVVVIDEESAFTRLLQDDLEQRDISVACVYSSGDEEGAAVFAPNAVVAAQDLLNPLTAGWLQRIAQSDSKLPLVLMTGANIGGRSPAERPKKAANSQIIATLAKPFEPSVLAELIDEHTRADEQALMDMEYIQALIASDRLLDNLVVEFQSKHALADGSLAGYEALSRLKTRRAISPATIFSDATEIALEIEATLNVVDQVISLSQSLRAQRTRVPVSFNCSAILLTQQNFVEALQARLQSSQIVRGSVIMEITEENRVANIQTVAEVCRLLSGYGLTISIDDYGTGQSNLDRIAAFPFGELKLDKEIFWAFCNNRVPISVIRSIIDFCHERGATTVVEGIETPYHLAQAKLLGADHGQGFYWGHAVPPQYLVKEWHGS